MSRRRSVTAVVEVGYAEASGLAAATREAWQATRSADLRYLGQAFEVPVTFAEKELGKLGWDAGEKAVAVRPNGADGHYFAGIALDLETELSCR